MSILTAQTLGHSFGADDLFTDFHFRLDAKERVGLVGPNGIGKTTLLLILAGKIEPEEGTVAHRTDLTIGYLRQEAVLTFAGQDNSIYEEMLSVFANLVEIEREMSKIEGEMSAGAADSALFDRYSDLQNHYDAGGGYEYQLKIRQVLEGLGFEKEIWATPLQHLSGGQKTRILLGRLLLEAPDLLIMDEPTNHLDSSAVEWLERTLKNYPGTLLLVSHDRYFLDRVTTAIWEMSAEELRQYKGNYSSYVRQRQAEYDREIKLFEAEMERLTGELDWIRRHIAGGKTDMAKGKLKRLTRDIVLIEEVGVLGKEGKAWSEIGGRVRTLTVNEAADRLKGIEPPSSGPPRLNIKLTSEERSGILVLKTQRLRIGYPDTFLFKSEKIRLERGDCAAIIGPNGSGKTTLIKTLLGEISPLRGSVSLGDNVKIGYFAQAHDQLDGHRRVIDEILADFPLGERQARNHLAAYLFRGEDVFKEVSALSGGERGRLALAKLALEEANFLLLDEPTNHLDIPSQEVLQEVLERFDGTMLLVSHDRYLIDRLATQIWSLHDEELSIFYGSYADYLVSQGSERDGKRRRKLADQQGAKVDIKKKDAAPLPEADLSWVEEIERPASAPKKKGARRGSSAIHRAAAYLERLHEELELAQLSKDEDEIKFLEAEISAAETELEALGGQL